jgi:hypothetical protein
MVVIRMSSNDQGIPDRVLSDELLYEAVEHVAEEAHLWTARYRAIMVVVHGKLSVDSGKNIRLVEVCKYVGKDDSSVSVPSDPCVGSCKTVKNGLGVDVKFWGEVGGIAIDHKVVCFGFRAGRFLKPIWVEGASIV